jgi:hypothetical protein
MTASNLARVIRAVTICERSSKNYSVPNALMFIIDNDDLPWASVAERPIALPPEAERERLYEQGEDPDCCCDWGWRKATLHGHDANSLAKRKR